MRIAIGPDRASPSVVTKAIGYVRVSTDEQATNGISLAAQEAKLRAWATLHDVEIVIEVDAGISAKTLKRPGLTRALAAVGKGTILVVADLSRLSRSTRDTLTIAETLAKRGAELVSIKEQIPAGPAGRLILTVLAALNEMERAQISERTKGALGHLAAQGKRVSGHPPYGYRFGDAGELVEVEREQTIIAQAKAYRGSGMPLRAVSATLAESGLVTRGGRPFSASAVAEMVAG